MRKFVVKNKRIRDFVTREIESGTLLNNILTKVKHLEGDKFDFDYTVNLVEVLYKKNELWYNKAHLLSIRENIKHGGRLSDWFFAFPTLPVALFLGMPTLSLSIWVWAYNARKKKIVKPLHAELVKTDRCIKRLEEYLYEIRGLD